MKLHMLSDLHLEFADFHPQPMVADVVILAGDTYPAGEITGNFQPALVVEV